jgi:hypothetical protein
MVRHALPVLVAFVLLATEAHAQTRIPVAGVDPDVGFCDGTLDVAPRADGRLQTDLQLRFRVGRTLRVNGPLEPQGGTKWRAEIKLGPGAAGTLDGGEPGLGILTLDVDPDAGFADGRYATGPGGVTFSDHHPRPPVLDQRDVPPLAPTDPRRRTAVQVRYYGAAGYHVKRGADEILFAPFLSAPSFGDVAASEVMGTLRPDEKRIDEGLSGTDVSRSRAIIVGHGHYDHLIDVASIARRHARRAKIFCNTTSANILAGEPDAAALLARTEVVDSKLGQWIAVPGTRVRIMALEGDHPAHLLGIEFYAGNVDAPRTSPARRGTDFREGHTRVFLVDFLDDTGKVSYRIYYQDASPAPPKGSVPAAILAEHRVDLAIYCMSLHEHVRAFPTELTRNLDPRVIVGGHWEDIFRPMPGLGADRNKPLSELKLAVVLDTNPREFVKELNAVRSKDSRWIMPLPGSLYIFDPVP